MSKVFFNPFAGFGLCNRGNPGGIGSHISNMPFLIELLGQHHGLFGAEAQLVRGILLQGTGDERRIRLALAVAAFNILDSERFRSFQILLKQSSFFRIGYVRLFAIHCRQIHFKQQRRILFLQHGVNRPIFRNLKRFDFTFAITDQADSHGLDPAGAQATTHFLPKQRTQFVANNPVEDTTRLLRIDHILVNDPGMFYCFRYGCFGDLIELNPASVSRSYFQQCSQMPGNRFAFAVRVSCEINCFCLASQLEKFIRQGSFPADCDIFRFKAIIHINAELAFGQVAQMPHGRFHEIIRLP